MDCISLAILLTVHDRKDKTLRCLRCVFEQLPVGNADIDIYLTDDGCTDGTAEQVKSIFPEVTVIEGNGELYWNRGMHRAWEEAAKKDYDFYLWLNDDTYIFRHTIKELLASSAEVDHTAIIAGATQSETNRTCTYGLRGGQSLLIPNGQLQQGQNLNGNVVLIPRSIFRQLGNLDPHYQHAGGDTDYGLRAIKAGISLLLHKEYVGYCEAHEHLSKWCNPEYPLRKRWRDLNRPTGMPLKQLFYHERKHYGIAMASFHTATTIIHCLFPSLWIRYKL